MKTTKGKISSILVEDLISYLVDRKKCFWGYIDLDGITVNVYDEAANQDIFTIMFWFEEENSVWINDKPLKLKELQETFEDFEYVGEDYRDDVSDGKVWNIDTKITLPALLFIMLTYLVKENDEDLMINFFYSYKDDDTLSFSISNGDSSIIDYDMEKHMIITPETTSDDQELRSFIEYVYNSQLQRVLDCYDI